jgi:cytochrome b561
MTSTATAVAPPATQAETQTRPRYTAALRIWHWGNALVITGLLSTIWFMRVIIDVRGLRPKIRELAAQSGIALSLEQAKAISKLVSHRIWDYHTYLGVGLAGLLALRGLAELTAASQQRFGHRLRQARAEAGAAALVKYSYLAFYLMLVVIVGTGLGILYADDVAWLASLEETLKDIHTVDMYLIIGFLFVHIVGVVANELTMRRNVTSDMVHGGAAEE